MRQVDLTASGDGEITRRVLSLDLVQKTGIDKEYDREKTLRDTDTKHWNKLTDNDSLGNVKYADGSTAENKLVSGDGTSFEITSNYMDNAPLPAANWDVRRDGFGQVISKDILYRIMAER